MLLKKGKKKKKLTYWGLFLAVDEYTRPVL